MVTILTVLSIAKGIELLNQFVKKLVICYFTPVTGPKM